MIRDHFICEYDSEYIVIGALVGVWDWEKLWNKIK